MPRKLEPPPESLLIDYLTSDPSVSSIAFESAVYPVNQGRISLTAAQAAPFLALESIHPAPLQIAATTSQPTLELPAE